MSSLKTTYTLIRDHILSITLNPFNPKVLPLLFIGYAYATSLVHPHPISTETWLTIALSLSGYVIAVSISERYAKSHRIDESRLSPLSKVLLLLTISLVTITSFRLSITP